jgi:hypothetical protein
MTIGIAYNGVSVLNTQIPAARRVEINVTGTTGTTSAIISCDGVQVGSSTSAVVLCDFSKVTPGSHTLTAKIRGTVGNGSFVKPASFIPDPQPGPNNTGPQVDDSELTPYTGGWIRTPTTLEGMLFTTALVIKAPLVLRNSVMRCSTVAGGRIINVDSAVGGSLLMEDCEIDGLTGAVLGIGYSDLTIRRCNIHSCSDGIRVGSRCLVEDNWIHDLSRQGDLHPDCIQTTGGHGVTIRHNNMNCIGVRDTGQYDLGNSCIQLGGETSSVGEFEIVDNWMDGGNYTLNCRSDAAGPILVDGNRFGPNHRYGEIARPREDVNNMTLVNNVDSNGSPVVPRYW